MWFIFTIVTTLFWGTADLFYKKGADVNDKYSHLKTAMMVGFVMGIHAIYTLISSGISYNPKNLLIYLPVSAMYILSMVIGYFGFRYLELSIASPIQNTSGAVTFILCLIFLQTQIETLTLTGVIFICVGMLLLGMLEKIDAESMSKRNEKKYTIGFIAIIIPIIYCIIDSLGTFFDAYYLDDFASTPLVDVTEDTLEDVANISYELSFLIVALVILGFLIINAHKKETISAPSRKIETSATSRKIETSATSREIETSAPSRKIEISGPSKSSSIGKLMKTPGFSAYKNRLLAALFETGGQAFYVFAMSGNGTVAAPIISCYAVVSLILSRIFLKEKLSRKHYIAISIIIVGIGILGFCE